MDTAKGIDQGSDIHSGISHINPASPATVIVFYHSHQLLFPGAKSWYFFITRTGKQGLVTGSGANFFFLIFYFYLVQIKGLLLTISS